jgi:hypothetical protein
VLDLCAPNSSDAAAFQSVNATGCMDREHLHQSVTRRRFNQQLRRAVTCTGQPTGCKTSRFRARVLREGKRRGMNYVITVRLNIRTPTDRPRDLQVGVAIVAREQAVSACWAMEFVRALELELLPIPVGETIVSFESIGRYVRKIESTVFFDDRIVNTRGLISTRATADAPPMTDRVVLAFKPVGGATASQIELALAHMRQLPGCESMVVLSACRPELILRC